MPAVSLLDRLADLTDPRDRKGTRYPLVPLLALALVAIPAGNTSAPAVAPFGRHRLGHALGFPHGKMPCANTLANLFAELDPDFLDRVIGVWLADRHADGREHITLDGKTLRGSRDGPCRLTCDPGQLKQVLLNLILNSADAMPTGGRLTISLIPAETGVELCVADSGTGIPSEILPRLFESFVSSKETGTGLGLVVCRRIVEEHGGTLTGENAPGGGARFTLRLPRRKPDEVARTVR